MIKYLLENWIAISGLIIATFAIFVPIYFQYFRNKTKNETIEIPKTIIIALSESQASLKLAEMHNRSLYKELENTKLLSKYPSYSDQNLETRIKNIIDKNFTENIDTELEKLIYDILLEKEFKLENLFKNSENEFIIEFLKSYPYKDKTVKYLLEVYLNDQSLIIQYNSSLLWIQLMENESIIQFLSEEFKIIGNNDLNSEKLIVYFWNLVNVGFTYYNTNSILERRNSLEKKFTELYQHLLDQTFSHLNTENQKVLEACSWALGWLLNSRYDLNSSFYKFSEDEISNLYSALTKSNRPKAINSILIVLNTTCISTYAYKDNFAYECANSIDNSSYLQNLNFEPINDYLCQVIYSKYLISSEEIKEILAKYLAIYGFKEISVAIRLLSTYTKEKNDSFILFGLLPYLSLIADKSLISYITEWINSEDKLIKFYGVLFQKAIEKENNIALELISGNEYSFKSLSQIKYSSKVKLFNKKKTSALYNIINLMLENCTKITGKDSSGRMAWYVLLTTPENEKLLSRFFHDKSLNMEIKKTLELTDYGIVILSAYGEEFPENLIELILEKYS